MANEKVEKVLDIKVNYADAIAGIAKYSDQLDRAKRNEEALKTSYKEQLINRTQYNIKMAESKKATIECNEKIKVYNQAIRNQIKIEQEQEGSLTSLRAQLSSTTAQYDKLSRSERNSAKGQELKDKINATTKELKAAEEETGRFYRSVGSYKDAILTATGAQIPYLNALKQNTAIMSGLTSHIGSLKGEMSNILATYKANTVAVQTYSGAQKAAAITSNLLSTALKVLKLALISTGIGAIVVLIGSLVAWLAKTQAGTEALSKVMASFGAVINVIIDRIAKFGGALVKILSGDIKGGFKDMKDSFAGIGEEIANDAKQAYALKEALIQLEKQQVMLDMKRAASRAEIEKLRLLADDTTKSLDERLKAAQRAYDIENALQQESIEIGKKKLANMLGQTELTAEANDLIQKMAEGAITADEAISQIGISQSTMEDLKEFSRLFGEVASAEAESYSRSRGIQKKMNQMRKQESDNFSALKQKELAEVRKAEDEMLKLIQDEREKQAQTIALQYNRQIEDLKTRLATETGLTVTAKQELNNQILALEQQRDNDLQKLSNDALAKEISARQKLIALQLEGVKQ